MRGTDITGDVRGKEAIGGEEERRKACEWKKRTLAANKTLLLERRYQHRLIGGTERSLKGERTRRELIGSQIGLILNTLNLVSVKDGLAEAL